MVQSKYLKRLNLYKEAKLKDIPFATTEIIIDTIIDSQRNIKIIIKPQRQVNRIQLLANNDINFNKISVNNQMIKPNSDENTLYLKKAKSIVTYFLSENESLELDLWIPKNENPEIKIYETSYDLLSNNMLNVKQRPEEMTPLPFYINDAIVLTKTIKF